jgi:hypothetical protein
MYALNVCPTSVCGDADADECGEEIVASAHQTILGYPCEH